MIINYVRGHIVLIEFVIKVLIEFVIKLWIVYLRWLAVYDN
jgi:hypothetical protein